MYQYWRKISRKKSGPNGKVLYLVCFKELEKRTFFLNLVEKRKKKKELVLKPLRYFNSDFFKTLMTYTKKETF